MNGGLRLLRSLAAGCALGVASASGAVRVIGEDGYDPARGVIANLDAIVRAAFAETNACIIVTPVPRGLAKGDPARTVSGRVADEVFKLCDNRRKFYLDVRPGFLNRDGSLKAEYYAADGLALNAAGRDRLSALVRPLAGWIAAPSDEPAPATKFGWKHFYSANLHLSLAGRPWWWDRVIRNVEAAERLRRTRGGRVDVLLIGDSISHHWEDTGASFYAEICDRREVLNLANGGDLPYQQQWLLDNGVVDGIKAKLVQVMIGTNDHDEPEKKFGRIRKLVETVRAKQPEAKIVLCAILPRMAEKDAVECERNERVNAQLRSLCDGGRTVFLDVGEPMRRALGEPVETRRRLAGDLLHPSVLMYRHWLECLRPHLPPPAPDLRSRRHVTAFAVGRTRERGGLALPELDQALAKAVVSPRQATHVYLRYRTTCPELAGILYTRGVDDRYHSDFGFWPDGKVHDAVIALEGWSRSGKRLRLDESASFVFKFGEGEIELIEVGVVR